MESLLDTVDKAAVHTTTLVQKGAPHILHKVGHLSPDLHASTSNLIKNLAPHAHQIVGQLPLKHQMVEGIVTAAQNIGAGGLASAALATSVAVALARREALVREQRESEALVRD